MILKNHTLKINIIKENATLKFLKSYFSVIFSIAFVLHDENDSRIGFSHNNSESNLIITGFKISM